MKIERVVFGIGCAALMQGCMQASTDGEKGSDADEQGLGEVRQEVSVSGMSRYCSRTYPTHGWTFHFGTNSPCSDDGTGGKIERAGLYSTAGTNNVVARCAPNALFYRSGPGDAPLQLALADAAAASTSGDCIFTVSAAKTPIFAPPFPSWVTVSHGSGFDHNRVPYDDGTELDYRGKTVSFLINHDAEDLGMPTGTPLYAAADGYVLTAGMFKGTYTGCKPPLVGADGIPDCGDEGIVIIKHTVSTGSALYDEYFASGYFHMQAIDSKLLAKCAPVDKDNYLGGGCSSAWVAKGDLIGYVGRRNTPQAHVHFATWRLTNTARRFYISDAEFAAPAPFNFTSVGPTVLMDSMGWQPSPTSDPWAYAAYDATAAGWPGGGTLSTDLWIKDLAINW